MSDVILDISLWPNSEGTLGVNKVAIPDGVTTLWPEGDALVENFVYKDGKLVGLVDNKALIENESRTTVIPYDFVDITMNKRLESLMTFNAGERCKHLNINYEVMLPVGYKRLKYLQATGMQYIDTGLIPDSDTGCRIETEPSQYIQFTLLAGAGSEKESFVPLQSYSNNTIGFSTKAISCYPLLDGSDTEKGKEALSGGYKAFGRITVELNYKNSGIWNYSDSLNEVSRAISLRSFGLNLYLFARNYNNMSPGDTYFYGWDAPIYSARFSKGQNLSADFIPALDPTGAPCMFDIISQEPFYNEGTGDFLYPGAESQVVTSDLDENFYAKKTEHGIHRLYHVPENYTGSKEDYASENGFKQLVEPSMPTEGYWIPEWTETDTQLICNWIETETLSEQ